MCRCGWGGYITPARAPHPPTRSPTHEDAIDQDSPSVVSRHPLGNLELKKIPEPSIFRPFPPSSIPSAPVSNSQAGDGDVAGVPGVKWLGYAQEASNEYPRAAPVQTKENISDCCASRRAQGARILIGSERNGTTRKRRRLLSRDGGRPKSSRSCRIGSRFGAFA